MASFSCAQGSSFETYSLRGLSLPGHQRCSEGCEQGKGKGQPSVIFRIPPSLPPWVWGWSRSFLFPSGWPVFVSYLSRSGKTFMGHPASMPDASKTIQTPECRREYSRYSRQDTCLLLSLPSPGSLPAWSFVYTGASVNRFKHVIKK